MLRLPLSFFFFFNDTAPTEIYTLSLHDALPILGTVEGPGRRLRRAAARADRVGEEHELGPLVLLAEARELPGPGALQVVEHERHEVRGLFLGGRALPRRRRRPTARRRREVAPTIEQREEVLAEDQAQHQQDDRAAQADAAAHAQPSPSGRFASPVLEVLAAVSASPAHGLLLRLPAVASQPEASLFVFARLAFGCTSPGCRLACSSNYSPMRVNR